MMANAAVPPRPTEEMATRLIAAITSACDASMAKSTGRRCLRGVLVDKRDHRPPALMPASAKACPESTWSAKYRRLPSELCLRKTSPARCHQDQGPKANTPSSPTLVRRIVAALFPRVPDEQALPPPLQAGAIVKPSPWKNFEEHVGGSRITLHLGWTQYQTPLSRSPLPRTLKSSCRCTRHACGPVSFQRAEKGGGLPCCQSQASPRRTIVVQAALYAGHSGQDSRKNHL
ncbi:unnamed protein product [Trichogramma brassicae]|uniref:Uncharacterized protein n=1 Tax=Trichogramma brassicae TaxID=86971 RepID=A0A6H5IMM3_9HYME|nr:unnamed protein product [Trichogramma brassicae]